LNREVLRIKRTSPKVLVNEELCKGCGICMRLCPMKVLEKSSELSQRGVYIPIPTGKDKCTGCRICEYYCPDLAIYIEKNEEDGL
jgi:2-oxoglutarate ferredoxin oxidoreductase subunit delta